MARNNLDIGLTYQGQYRLPIEIDIPLSPLARSYICFKQAPHLSMLWLVVIYAKDLIQDLPLADPTMQMARNIVEDAKSISSMMTYFVLVVVWL